MNYLFVALAVKPSLVKIFSDSVHFRGAGKPGNIVAARIQINGFRIEKCVHNFDGIKSHNVY
jgi:hypothetical protein